MGCKDIPNGWKNKEMTKNVAFWYLQLSFAKKGLFVVYPQFSRRPRDIRFPAGQSLMPKFFP